MIIIGDVAHRNTILVMINHIYKLNFELPKVENYTKKLKEIKPLKYITIYLPDSIKEFINHSDVLKDYYIDAVNKLKIHFIKMVSKKGYIKYTLKERHANFFSTFDLVYFYCITAFVLSHFYCENRRISPFRNNY